MALGSSRRRSMLANFLPPSLSFRAAINSTGPLEVGLFASRTREAPLWKALQATQRSSAAAFAYLNLVRLPPTIARGSGRPEISNDHLDLAPQRPNPGRSPT